MPTLAPSWRTSIETPVALASSFFGSGASITVVTGTNIKPMPKP